MGEGKEGAQRGEQEDRVTLLTEWKRERRLRFSVSEAWRCD